MPKRARFHHDTPRVQSTQTHHDSWVLGATDDGRENGAGSVITGEAGLAHAGAIVDDEGLNLFTLHSERETGRSSEGVTRGEQGTRVFIKKRTTWRDDFMVKMRMGAQINTRMPHCEDAPC
jgi:hypothetical protein